MRLHSLINELRQTERQINVAIDGPSAAGKTTLAASLRQAYGCNVFSMDDFFLQPFQRTPERLGETGGNVDYERFLAEVAEPLKLGKPVVYRRYDCQTQTLSAPISVEPVAVNIIEGVYSLHPKFDAPYHIKVFVDIKETEQLRRIKQRNAALVERFINEWIPMEKRYFEAFGVKENCDLVIDGGYI